MIVCETTRLMMVNICSSVFLHKKQQNYNGKKLSNCWLLQYLIMVESKKGLCVYYISKEALWLFLLSPLKYLQVMWCLLAWCKLHLLTFTDNSVDNILPLLHVFRREYYNNHELISLAFLNLKTSFVDLGNLEILIWKCFFRRFEKLKRFICNMKKKRKRKHFPQCSGVSWSNINNFLLQKTPAYM